MHLKIFFEIGQRTFQLKCNAKNNNDKDNHIECMHVGDPFQ